MLLGISHELIFCSTFFFFRGRKPTLKGESSVWQHVCLACNGCRLFQSFLVEKSTVNLPNSLRQTGESTPKRRIQERTAPHFWSRRCSRRVSLSGANLEACGSLVLWFFGSLVPWFLGSLVNRVKLNQSGSCFLVP